MRFKWRERLLQRPYLFSSPVYLEKTRSFNLVFYLFVTVTGDPTRKTVFAVGKVEFTPIPGSIIFPTPLPEGLFVV